MMFLHGLLKDLRDLCALLLLFSGDLSLKFSMYLFTTLNIYKGEGAGALLPGSFSPRFESIYDSPHRKSSLAKQREKSTRTEGCRFGVFAAKEARETKTRVNTSC